MSKQQTVQRLQAIINRDFCPWVNPYITWLRQPIGWFAIAALAAGLVHGASAARGGSNWVSPMDVGRIAIGAGSGLLSGIVAGKILGALAGLTPAAENNVKRIGIWAGGLNAARNALK